MNREVTEFISKCETCNTFQSAQQKEFLICHETPQHPWEKIGCDIFTFGNQDYLCTVDYFSDYFEIDELHKSKTGATVIGKLPPMEFQIHFTVTMVHPFLQMNSQPLQ